MTRQRQLSLWAAVFAITDALQFFRGAWQDAAIFTAATLLVLASGTLFLNADWDSRKLVSDRWLNAGMAVLGLLFIIIPRHTTVGLVLVLAVLPAAVALVWGNHRGPRGQATAREKRARASWIIWAVVTAIWEFAANILGQLDRDLYSFPTISVLIEPLLDSAIGKAGFVVVWILAGIGLFRVARRHP